MGLISAVYIYPFVRTLCGAPDAGVFLNGADLLNRGAIPSRDFVEPQGPGSFVWLAIWFRLFGPTLETARAVLAATGIALGLLTFWLSRRLGATGVFAAAFVVVMSVPLMPVNSPHYDSNVLALGALAIFLTAWDRVVEGEEPATWRLAAAAALCGVTTWSLQQKGALLAVALIAALVCLMRKRAVKPVLVFAGVFSALAFFPFAVFAAKHALPDVLYANYIWPMTTYSDINAAPYGSPLWQHLVDTLQNDGSSPVARMQALTFGLPLLLVATLPLVLPLAAGWSGRPWLQIPMFPYWFAAYALWVSELHRIDIGHLRNGAMLMAVLFFSICEASGRGVVRRAGLVLTLCIVLTGMTHFLMSWQGEKRETRRGTVYVEGDTAVLDFLDSHTQAGDEVFVYPYQPIYYFLENLRNPTRFSYMLYRFNTKSQFLEATEDLERKEVRYVVFDKEFSGPRLAQVFPAYRQPADRDLIMEPYLAAHYGVVSEGRRFRVLQRLGQ